MNHPAPSNARLCRGARCSDGWLTDPVQPERRVYLESGVGMAHDAGSAVWSFDLDLWGSCWQGTDPESALAQLAQAHPHHRIAEHIHGDELAFARDHQPASDDELEATVDILTGQRRRCLRLLATLPPDLLDHDDPWRVVPAWATWRTIRQMMWHITDTESRYYLPQTGLAGRDREPELETELKASAAHVRRAITAMPRDQAANRNGEVWTATKLLRRLAWHERGELEAIETLAQQFT